jgi:release factor glutamine methyltransferase
VEADTRTRTIAALRAAGCVFAEEEAELLLASARGPHELAAMVARRCAGEPVETVVGWVDFCGVRLTVDPGVFVPRRRTQVLARVAVAAATRAGSVANARTGATVVELCCGAGAIAAVVAASVTGVRLFASDIDAAAVRCAQRNLAPYGVLPVVGDLFDGVPAAFAGAVDVLVANVPYVPSAEVAYLPAEAREHEPRIALDGGADGLDVLRRIAIRAPSWLAPGGGTLMVETSLEQAGTASTVMAESGLRPDLVCDDDLEVAVVIGRVQSS